MAQKPYKHIIKLRPEERKELKELLRNRKIERRIADRARMIVWADEGVSIGETVKRLGCSKQIVVNWRRDFLARREEEGLLNALKDRSRPGRPRVFSPRADDTSQSDSV